MLNDFSRLKYEIGDGLGRITLRISARRIGGRDRAENRDLQFRPQSDNNFPNAGTPATTSGVYCWCPSVIKLCAKIIKQNRASSPLNRKIHHSFCLRF